MTLADHIGLLKYLDKENDKKLAESPNDLFYRGVAVTLKLALDSARKITS